MLLSISIFYKLYHAHKRKLEIQTPELVGLWNSNGTRTGTRKKKKGEREEVGSVLIFLMEGQESPILNEIVRVF